LDKDVQVVNFAHPNLAPMGHLLEIEVEKGIYIGPLTDAENIEAFNGVNLLTWVPYRVIDMLCELKPIKLDATENTTSTG
jgi:hypothetical protein